MSDQVEPAPSRVPVGGAAHPPRTTVPLAQADAADLSVPQGPVRAGVPSSGNWQMPEWMREEGGEGTGGGFNLPEAETGGGKGRVVRLAVIGLVVVALLAAAAMYLLKSGDKSKGASKS